MPSLFRPLAAAAAPALLAVLTGTTSPLAANAPPRTGFRNGTGRILKLLADKSDLRGTGLKVELLTFKEGQVNGNGFIVNYGSAADQEGLVHPGQWVVFEIRDTGGKAITAPFYLQVGLIGKQDPVAHGVVVFTACRPEDKGEPSKAALSLAKAGDVPKLFKFKPMDKAQVLPWIPKGDTLPAWELVPGEAAGSTSGAGQEGKAEKS